MKRISYGIFCLVMMSVSSVYAKGDVGAPCDSNKDCKKGICLDLALSKSSCVGKVCSIACKDSRDCPEVAKGRDCDPVKGMKGEYCLYGEWEEQYCHKDK